MAKPVYSKGEIVYNPIEKNGLNPFVYIVIKSIDNGDRVLVLKAYQKSFPGGLRINNSCYEYFVDCTKLIKISTRFVAKEHVTISQRDMNRIYRNKDKKGKRGVRRAKLCSNKEPVSYGYYNPYIFIYSAGAFSPR